MTVYERIAEAMQVIAETEFTKSGKVTGGAAYNFIPIGQILHAIRKAHAKAGLFLTIGQLEYDTDHGEGIYTSDRWTKARGHCEVSINGADGDSVSFIVPFNVQDNSDKLDNKIVTNIERQAYRVIYAIDEGDATDPEAEWYADEVTSSPTKKDTFFDAPPAKETRTPKASVSQDPVKTRLINRLTKIMMDGGNDSDILMTMLNGRKMDDLSAEELKEIIDAVKPFGGA